MMRERLFYDISSEQQKKEILLALKNEQKYRKQIPLVDNNEEEICKVIKWEPYNTYIDFYLNNYISDTVTEKAGRLKNIETYDYETSKGSIKRIKFFKA